LPERLKQKRIPGPRGPKTTTWP